jgi:hypothetical protein
MALKPAAVSCSERIGIAGLSTSVHLAAAMQVVKPATLGAVV